MKSHVAPAAVFFVLLVAGSGAVSPGSASGADTGPRAAGPSTLGARIVGAAWTSDSQAVPNANLRLRNVVTGKIEATTIANSSGQFTFQGIEGGSYVIELVNDSGKVVALGHTISVAPGETVATFVRLGSKLPWFSAFTSKGFFTNAASSALSAASNLGVTALGSSGIPASPQQ